VVPSGGRTALPRNSPDNLVGNSSGNLVGNSSGNLVGRRDPSGVFGVVGR
jgi:hypothetical protein